jgi:hypothetical protein
VEQAATVAGVKAAPWLCSMVRQIITADVPASWEAERFEERSHDSWIYGIRFMLRLNEAARTTRQALVKHVHVSKAELIRQLIAQDLRIFPRAGR